MAKETAEFKKFDAAMGAILKADPAKVKAEMKTEKRQREEQRKAKEPPSALGRVSGGKG